MIIEQLFPRVVEARDDLRWRLVAEARAARWTHHDVEELVSSIPVSLLSSPCFKDKLTGLWRYEFGHPYHLKTTNELLWGTHMWVPVTTLFAVFACARRWLADEGRRTYLQRLANPEKHQDVLAEMAPMLRVSACIPVRFEVPRMGKGNKTVDWLIGPRDGRLVLLEVKRRAIDLIRQMERLGGDKIVPEPDHDPAVLFKSVEEKFEKSNPTHQLQGVWVVTDIKQERSELAKAFDFLDATKVHFAVLGDFKPDVHLLVRRSEDRQFLLDTFQTVESPRSMFERTGPN